MTPPLVPNLLQKYTTEIAVAVATLAALGYVIVSPRDQMQAMEKRVVENALTQAATDLRQDQLIQTLTFRAADDKREIQADLNLLVIAQCMQTKSGEMYAQLRCDTRLGKRP